MGSVVTIDGSFLLELFLLPMNVGLIFGSRKHGGGVSGLYIHHGFDFPPLLDEIDHPFNKMLFVLAMGASLIISR